MKLTEEEAKTRWCPDARVSGSNRMSRTLDHAPAAAAGRQDCACIASRCMAWRWDGPMGINQRVLGRSYLIDGIPAAEAIAEPPRPRDVPASWVWLPYDPEEGDHARWSEPAEDAQARRQGYCGRAGDRVIE